MKIDKPPSAGRPRDPALDGAILSVALQLFADGGLPGVSFDQVSKRSGVSRAAIYRRWRTREALVVAALQALRAQAEAGFADWAQRPLDEVLDLFERQLAQAFGDPRTRKLLRQILALESEGAEIRRLYWEALVLPRRRAFSRMILAARRDGELDGDADPELIQDQLAGALTYKLLLDPRGADTDIAAYAHALLVGLGLRRAGSTPRSATMPERARTRRGGRRGAQGDDAGGD